MKLSVIEGFNMKWSYSVILFILILVSCSSEQSDSIPEEYHLDFQEMQFSNDQRIQMISELDSLFYEAFRSHAVSRHIPGLSYGIVVDDSLVIKRSLGMMHLEEDRSMHPDAVFRIASMTKSITAMAILMLDERGLIDINNPAHRYVPELTDLAYPTADAPVITVENLLTMTAGFPEDNPWGDRQLDESEAMLTTMMSDGFSFSNIPSYQFEYSNTGYAILGRIISNVSGKPYQEFIKEEIFEPLGMNNTYWEFEEIPDTSFVQGYRWEEERWKPEPVLHDGAFGAMGGLITTIDDFAKYVGFHLSAWPSRNEADDGIVRRSTLRTMHTPQYVRMNSNAKDYLGNACPTIAGYGYGLGITEDCHGVKWVAHGGALPGYGSNYLFFPEYGIGILAFGNLTYTSPWPLQEILHILREDTRFQARNLEPSDVLQLKKEELLIYLENWDEGMEQELFAENFFPDFSRSRRKAEYEKVLGEAGAIERISEMKAMNQLRGTFIMNGANKEVEVFFTLTPEKEPKIQRLDFRLK